MGVFDGEAGMHMTERKRVMFLMKTSRLVCLIKEISSKAVHNHIDYLNIT